MTSGQISPDQAHIRLWHAILQGTERCVGFPSGSLDSVFSRSLARGRPWSSAVDDAVLEVNTQIRPVLEKAMNAVLDSYEEIQVPPEVVFSTLGVRPQVVPEYRDVAADSQLGRVMFWSDYLGKHLTNAQEFSKVISGYQTEFAFERSHPRAPKPSGSTQTFRLWISVDKLDLAQFADGHTLEFRDVSMRFNVRELGAHGRDLPVSPNSYEQLLTPLYDEFAVRFPVLHELEECGKLEAVAEWLKKSKPDLRLPKDGRVTWKGPTAAPGVVYLTWSPKYRPGAVHMAMVASGGVSLVPPWARAAKTQSVSRLNGDTRRHARSD